MGVFTYKFQIRTKKMLNFYEVIDCSNKVQL